MTRERGDEAEYQAHRRSAPQSDLGPLFAPPARPKIATPRELPAGMVRSGDHDTSLAAALLVEPHLSELQHAVLEAITFHGAMNDEQIERLPEFAGKYAPSTIRHRRTDLVTMRKLAWTGYRTASANGSSTLKVWDLASRVRT